MLRPSWRLRLRCSKGACWQQCEIDLNRLAGQIAIITGAGGGIGQALARALTGEGATAYLVGRRRELLEETARGCGVDHTRVCPTDLTKASQIDKLVGGLLENSGGVDILVHCAGVIAHGKINCASVESLDAQYAANVRAPYVLTQRLLPMLTKVHGQVVFINSSVVTGPRAGVSQFSATQHALRAIADTLRQEVNGEGVRVLSVFPGRTATARQEALHANEGKQYRPELLLQPEEIATMVIAALTLPRTAEVTDISIRPMLKSY